MGKEISNDKAALLGFNAADELYQGYIRNIEELVKSLLLWVDDADKLYLPPDELEENLSELISASKDFIFDMLKTLLNIKSEVFMYREMIEDDGVYSQCIQYQNE